VPAALGGPEDLRIPRLGERLLVEGVGDYLAQRVRHRPVFQHPLDIEVELTHHAYLPVKPPLRRAANQGEEAEL
jgi:hypothetical protein